MANKLFTNKKCFEFSQSIFVKRVQKIIFFLVFIFSDYFKCKKILSEEIKNIKMVNLKLFTYGHRCRFFFTGFYNDKKVFIKIGYKDQSLENEIYINQILSVDNDSFFPTLVKSDNSFLTIAVFSCINFSKVNDNFYNKENFEMLCNTFLFILRILRKHKVIHGDIQRKNFSLSNNLLFDFDNCYFDDSNIKIIPVGGSYIEMNGDIIYDDAIAIVKYIKSLPFDNNLFSSSLFNNIIKEQGKFYYNKTKDVCINEDCN